MIFFTIVIILISIYEIIIGLKNRQKKDIVIYLGAALITLLSGLYYLSDPDRDSIGRFLNHTIGFRF